MLIVSWNVAGLATTAQRIHDAYHPARAKGAKTASNNASCVALQEYMTRHGADIFCVQEHKIPLAQLKSRSEPRGCSVVEGYESFWSCCVDKNKRGLNGVVTYVKKGMVCRAQSCPLGADDLDGQGRCVMTDHGSFVVFNVYVPASGGQPLAYKMKFLYALRKAMQEQRKTKPVVLVGDLNIAHTELDVYWKDRVVHIYDILEQVAAAPPSNASEDTSTSLPQWKVDVAQSWSKILEALQTKEVVSTQTTNTLTGEKFDKFRMCVTVENRRVFLGKHESSRDYCLYNYELDGSTYIDPATDEVTVASERNVVSVDILSELMGKIVGIRWDHETQRLIATTDATVRRLSPPRQWLQDVIEQDGMVDPFRHYYPMAEARFTCWDQFTNRRYANEGIRIDYTLVDKKLQSYVQQGAPLRCCSSPEDPLGERAALCAATASGAFQPVSFEGEGITAASQAAMDTQFGEPHTGILYTPPSFSDHVGVSLLLDDACCPRNLLLDEKDESTRKAQPHKVQKSIATYFSSKSNDSPTCKSLAKKRKLDCTAERKTLKSFFAPLQMKAKPLIRQADDQQRRTLPSKEPEGKGGRTFDTQKRQQGTQHHVRK